MDALRALKSRLLFVRRRLFIGALAAPNPGRFKVVQVGGLRASPCCLCRSSLFFAVRPCFLPFVPFLSVFRCLLCIFVPCRAVLFPLLGRFSRLLLLRSWAGLRRLVSLARGRLFRLLPCPLPCLRPFLLVLLCRLVALQVLIASRALPFLPPLCFLPRRLVAGVARLLVARLLFWVRSLPLPAPCWSLPRGVPVLLVWFRRLPLRVVSAGWARGRGLALLWRLGGVFLWCCFCLLASFLPLVLGSWLLVVVSLFFVRLRAFCFSCWFSFFLLVF